MAALCQVINIEVPSIGELVQNPHASPNNPRKNGYFAGVVIKRSVTRVKPSNLKMTHHHVYWKFTDGNGHFWLTDPLAFEESRKITTNRADGA